jgi:fatty-acyl-CoA synthase/long-chain acyl-CoA synthetase
MGSDDFVVAGVAAVAKTDPDRLAVEDDFGQSVTFGELDRLVDLAIHALADLGVGRGDVVAVLAENRVETVLVHQAALRGGFYFTSLNAHLRTDEIRYLVADSGAKVVATDAEHLDLAQEVVGDTSVEVIVIDADYEGPRAGSLYKRMESAPTAPVSYQFGSWLGYTSGTTGWPKGVIRDVGAQSVDDALEWMRFGLNLGLRESDERLIVPAPLYHGGPMLLATYALNLGGSVHLMRRFDAELTLELIEQWRATSAYMVPTMFHRLLRLPEAVRRARDVGSMRTIMHTAAPCPIDIKRQIIDWFGPILIEAYACTEGFGAHAICTSSDWLLHPGTVGKPIPGMVTIRDESHAEVPVGETGLVYLATFRGTSPFAYKDDAVKTAEAYGPSGQFTVGDTGYVDDEGFLYLTGRVSDMIISGGVNIYPAEAEHVLINHPTVADVGVIGVPDDEWGERVVACVQVERGTTPSDALAAELIEFCRGRIAPYKCPRDVIFLDELSRDASGKLRKRYLVELAGKAAMS